MGRYDAVGDRQPEAQSIGAAGDEWLPHAGEPLGCDADPVIRKHDHRIIRCSGEYFVDASQTAVAKNVGAGPVQLLRVDFLSKPLQ